MRSASVTIRPTSGSVAVVSKSASRMGISPSMSPRASSVPAGPIPRARIPV
jgi:hypothetical protein